MAIQVKCSFCGQNLVGEGIYVGIYARLTNKMIVSDNITDCCLSYP